MKSIRSNIFFKIFLFSAFLVIVFALFFNRVTVADNDFDSIFNDKPLSESNKDYPVKIRPVKEKEFKNTLEDDLSGFNVQFQKYDGVREYYADPFVMRAFMKVFNEESLKNKTDKVQQEALDVLKTYLETGELAKNLVNKPDYRKESVNCTKISSLFNDSLDAKCQVINDIPDVVYQGAQQSRVISVLETRGSSGIVKIKVFARVNTDFIMLSSETGMATADAGGVDRPMYRACTKKHGYNDKALQCYAMAIRDDFTIQKQFQAIALRLVELFRFKMLR